MFKYNCVIEFSYDFSPVLDLLEKLGYRPIYPQMYVDRYLVTNADCDGYPVFYFQETLPIGDYINCEDNIQYFMEVAAISDSTDFHQVFVLNRGYVNKNGVFALSGSRMLCLSDKFPYSEFNAHKATIEEIYNYYQS